MGARVEADSPGTDGNVTARIDWFATSCSWTKTGI